MKGNVSKAGARLAIADGKVYAIDGSSKVELAHGYQNYGVSIDLSNDNPETAVTYINDAIGMISGSPDWYKVSIFNRIKPCLFKNGGVVGYLNKDNFAQFEDGSAADITSGDSGDVMIEIPKMGYKISKSGKNLTVQITDYPDRKDFCYKAHTRTEEGDRDKLYIGAFLGSNVSGKLRSLSGRLPQTNTSLINLRAQAHANGAGYDLLSFYPLTLLQCLYLINYKNLNSQAALGMGCVNNGTYKKTGATIDKGMSYGSSSGSEQMKFLGIEDFWGNLYQWIDGIAFVDGTPIVATDRFNATGGFDNTGTYLGNLSPKSLSGFMKEPQGNNELGFVIGAAGGSSSTHFSDFSYYANGRAVSGGCYGDSNAAGAFYLQIGFSPDTELLKFGSRLMFL